MTKTRAISRAFKSDSMVGNTAIYLFVNILNGAIPFLLLPVMTRYLTPHEYGIVGMFQLLVTIFAAFTGLSLPNAMNRKYFDRENGIELSDFIGNCVLLICASIFFVGLVVVLFRDLFVEATGVPPLWVLAASFVSGMNFFVMARLGQWQVRNQSLRYGSFQILLSLMNMGVSVWLVVWLSGGFQGRLFGQSIAVSCFACLALISLRREGLLTFNLRRDYVMEALRFGVPLIPHVAGVFLLSMVDRFIIKQQLGLTAVGIYVVAFQLVMILAILTDAVNKAFVPWLYQQLKRADSVRLRRQLVARTYLYFAGVCLAASIVAFVGPWLVSWLIGDEYLASGKILGWLAFGLAFNAMTQMVAHYVYYSQQTSGMSVVTVLAGIIHLSLTVFLVSIAGIVGAAIAYAISMAIRFLMTWVLSQLKFSMPWRSPSFEGISL